MSKEGQFFVGVLPNVIFHATQRSSSDTQGMSGTTLRDYGQLFVPLTFCSIGAHDQKFIMYVSFSCRTFADCVLYKFYGNSVIFSHPGTDKIQLHNIQSLVFRWWLSSIFRNIYMVFINRLPYFLVIDNFVLTFSHASMEMKMLLFAK